MITISDAYTQRPYKWTDWKVILANKAFVWQMHEEDDIYWIWGYDGPECNITQIWKTTVPDGVIAGGYTQEQNDSDKSDFETNYKSGANKKLEALDSDGVPLQRLKVTKSSWSLHYHGIEISTSKLTVVNVDETNSDWGFATVKLYDGDGVQITDPGDDDINLASCVKTVVDWEPSFDFDIIGGEIFQAANPSGDVRVSVIGVPDIPANMGGSKAFMTGFNLKHLGLNALSLDGRTPKSLVKTVNHTNKIRFVLYHDAGETHTVNVMLNIFKQ